MESDSAADSYLLTLCERAMFDPDQKLVFLHQPKTAGTTVDSMLRSNFSEHEICAERDCGLVEWPQTLLDQKRYFSFHGSMSDVELVCGKKYVVTFFREPLTRLCSALEFDLSRSPEVVEKYNIRHIRYLQHEGIVGYLRAEQPSLRFRFWNPYATSLAGCRLCDFREGIWANEARLLDLALAALEEIDFIGISEFMENSLELLATALDIPKAYENLNISRTNWHTQSGFEEVVPIENSPQLTELMRINTAVDRMIYSIARKKARQSMASASIDIKQLNHHVGKVFKGKIYSTILCGEDVGFVLFGPGMRLGPGRYTAVFFLVTGETYADSYDPWLRFDVSFQKGAFEVESREVDQNFKEPVVSLEFRLEVPISDIEFRVRKVGAKPVRILKRVQLHTHEI